jgi:hypothetical protein
MKNLKDFILEGKKHVDTATVADFYQWACAGEMPDGKADVSIINPEDCKGLLDNGWFDNFDDSDVDKACKEIVEFFKKNWDKTIKVISEETPNDWEVSFKLNNTEYVAAFLTYFGDEYKE